MRADQAGHRDLVALGQFGGVDAGRQFQLRGVAVGAQVGRQQPQPGADPLVPLLNLCLIQWPTGRVLRLAEHVSEQVDLVLRGGPAGAV